jgi:PAT family beta-lactamase induction signal transducer AmpG
MIGGNTLNYWLAKEHIDLRTIGIFAFTSLPYAVNFLWAPIFDTKELGYLSKLFGQRLSWVLLIQIALSINVFILSNLNPTNHIFLFAIFALIISFLSSAQDSVLGALRTEIISKESQGVASGIYIFGYRIGMLISSSGAIYFSDYMGLNRIYELFSLVILICPILLIFNIRSISAVTSASEPIQQLVTLAINPRKGIISKGLNFMTNILKPVGSYSFLILAIIFLVLYRLPDNFITMMINPFLIHLEFGAREVASIGKFFGIITAIIGGFIASWVMRKKSIAKSLLIFGIIHALAHSLFIIQEMYGKNLPLLFLVIGFESITGGMTMAAYIAFIASLCQGKFRATQYSFFSAMMGLSRSIFPAISGYIVIEFGWQKFFIFTSLAAIPSLLLLLILMTRYKTK